MRSAVAASISATDPAKAAPVVFWGVGAVVGGAGAVVGGAAGGAGAVVVVAAASAGRGRDVTVVVVGAAVVDVAGADVDVAPEDDVVEDCCRRGEAALSASGSVQAGPNRAVNATRADIAFLCINPVLRSDPGSG